MKMRESMLRFLFLMAGLVVFVLLGIHIVVLHLPKLVSGKPEGFAISFESVVERGQSIFFTTIYIILLAASLYHGLYGLRSIFLELFTSKKAERAVFWVVSLLGLLTFFWGTYTTIQITLWG